MRGLRAVSDFEAELQMAHMNRRLAPEIDTVFFMTALEYGYLSSGLVREIARFGGDVVRDGAAGRSPPGSRHRRARSRVYNPGTITTGAEEGRPIDIMFFVERLEGMLANGKKLPLTSNVVVDQAAALELIDELRHAIPEEVQSARRVNAEGERILERANQEAERIVARAQEQAAYLIDEQGLTEAAEAESRRIIAEADEDGAATRRGADDYAADVLLRLEGEVSRVLGQIERGIEALGVRGGAGARDGGGRGGAGRARRRMTTAPADALVVNVAGLLGDPPGAHRDLAVDGVRIDLGEDLVQASPLEVRARIARTNRGVIVSGRVRTSSRRHVQPLPGRPPGVPRRSRSTRRSCRASSSPRGSPSTRPPSPRRHRLSDHHELDLEPLAREAILLAAPIAPVCRSECRGLCPECGVDLNAGPHDHGEAPVDPRLAKLRDFKVDE